MKRRLIGVTLTVALAMMLFDAFGSNGGFGTNSWSMLSGGYPGRPFMWEYERSTESQGMVLVSFWIGDPLGFAEWCATYAGVAVAAWMALAVLGETEP